jgi:chromosome segregation ATPase
MNKARRKQLSDLSTLVSSLIGDLQNEDPEVSWPDTKTAIDGHHDTAEAIKDEEQEYLDNMPASLQSGEKGDTAQNAIDNIESAMGKLEDAATACDDETPDLEEVVSALQEAVDSLDEASA